MRFLLIALYHRFRNFRRRYVHTDTPTLTEVLTTTNWLPMSRYRLLMCGLSPVPRSPTCVGMLYRASRRTSRKGGDRCPDDGHWRSLQQPPPLPSNAFFVVFSSVINLNFNLQTRETSTPPDSPLSTYPRYLISLPLLRLPNPSVALTGFSVPK